jgi:tyrosinase
LAFKTDIWGVPVDVNEEAKAQAEEAAVITSRRNLLLSGCAIGLGVMSVKLLPGGAFAQPASLPLRRSIHDLPLNDPIVEAWRDAVRQMKAKPAGDPLNWTNLASIHGTAAGFNRCPHGNWYFLPWHRAYILMYERITRELTGQADFAMPYWDWTTNRQLPQAYSDATFDGNPNPLFETRGMTPTDSLADEIVGPSVISTIFSETAFEVFGTSRPQLPMPQDSLDPTWIRRRTGNQGTLEGTPHNLVHGEVGGVMGGFQSANDPIFMMHHCNIDRIWALWRVNNSDTTDSLWLDMPFENHFFNPDGSDFSPGVADMLDPATLGYTYFPEEVVAEPLPPELGAYNQAVEILFSGQAAAVATVAQVFEVRNTKTATVAQPLEIPVTVDQALVASVARAPSAAAGVELFDFDLKRRLAAAAPRSLAFLRELSASNVENTWFRVFINCGYLSPDTPISDDHYVGTFGFFGPADDHGEHVGAQSMVLDIGPALNRLYGSVNVPPDQIRVQILPVLRPGSGEEGGTLSPQSVEVAFFSP